MSSGHSSVSKTVGDRDSVTIEHLGHNLDLSRSRDVIGHVTNRSAICHFLLVSHCNRTSISNRFPDIRPPKPVRTHRNTHRNTPQVYCIGQTIIILNAECCGEPSAKLPCVGIQTCHAGAGAVKPVR